MVCALAVFLFGWSKDAAAQKDGTVEPKQPAAKTDPTDTPATTLFKRKVRLGEQEYFFHLTSRRHTIPEVPGLTGEYTTKDGWVLELTALAKAKPGGRRPERKVVWRYWWWDLGLRWVPSAAHICAAPTAGECYLVVCYTHVFVLYKVNVHAAPAPLPRSPQEGSQLDYHTKTSGEVDGGPPFAEEIRRKAGIELYAHTVHVQTEGGMVYIICNAEGTTRIGQELSFAYNVGTKQWTWLREDRPPLEPSDIPEPSRFWQKNDKWILQVQQFPAAAASGPKKKQPTPVSYSLHVLLPNKASYRETDSWNLFFIPQKGTPQHLAQQRWIAVARETGWLKKAALFDGKKFADLDSFGDTSEGTFSEPPHGYPLEYFPVSGPPQSEISHGYSTWTIKRYEDEEGILIDATLAGAADGKEEWRVRQKWLPGEKWWREYERSVKGQKDLVATCDPPATVEPDPASREGKAKQGGSSSAAQPVPSNIDLSLRRDRRLHVKLAIQARNPPLSSLLSMLSRETGLKFTVAENLADHSPNLGHFQVTSAYAWAVMDFIALKDLKDGRWEKTATGYRLTGTSLVPRATPQAAAAPPLLA
ncbi:MAG TPA: hypothetical protein VNN17_08610, partial [Terriglobia bacterium]|nr:hypothetical protein [Terriglobia bacterium]